MSWAPFDWQNLEEPVVVGIDEVGRGCLAGPVYAAAAILDPAKNISQIRDSKSISENRRDEMAKAILRDHQIGIGFATVDEIAELNILQAALLAMKRAVENLSLDFYSKEEIRLLVDGNQKIPGLDGYKQTTLVKGDARATPVAAASIVAKATRDKLLRTMAKKYPYYGFEKHKGYSTAAHKKAIEEHGPCSQHRRTFAGS